MATLGTLSGNYKTTYTVSWSLLSQSTSNNTSTIRLTATFYTGNSTTISSSYSTFTLDGTTVYSGSYSFSGSGTKFTKTKDITVTHNSNGSFPGRTVSFSTNDFIMGNQSGSGTISSNDIPKINRYAAITTHEISQVTQDSIQVKWGADRSCSAVQYSLNGGSWTTPTSPNYPTYTIPNLKSGTRYTIKTRVQSADSGLWTESGTLTATTKEYVVKTKIMDIWKNAVPYVNINGEWKKAIPYVNVNGTWKSCIE